MIPFLLLLQTVEPVANMPAPIDPKYEACLALIPATPQLAIDQANKWGEVDGGWKAASCLGLAYAQLSRWDPAAAAFEQAAIGAQSGGHKLEAGILWTQAGNAMLPANNADRALAYFDKAEATGALKGRPLGQMNMDRARAAVMKGDMVLARTAMDKTVELSPDDPLGWLLSATLARRMNDITRAHTDIEKAMDLSPDDASVFLEAGNIAMVAGYPVDAEEAWRRAMIVQPNSEAAAAAKNALTKNDMGVPVGNTPAPKPSEETQGR